MPQLAKPPVLIVLSKPEDSLRELAATGASPTQMLWGMVWMQTVPKVGVAICRVVLGMIAVYLTIRYGPFFR